MGGEFGFGPGKKAGSETMMPAWRQRRGDRSMKPDIIAKIKVEVMQRYRKSEDPRLRAMVSRLLELYPQVREGAEQQA
jgi:hypothetical protein